MVNFGPLTVEICCYLGHVKTLMLTMMMMLASLRHPCKFQRGSRLGSVTARHCSSGRQPNFAALNRGHHLYSAGRPSRWALAHILVCNLLRQISCLSAVTVAFDIKRRSMTLFPVLPKPEVVLAAKR